MKKRIRELILNYKKAPIALRATMWFVICSTLQKSISIITTPIFTRILSTEQYGLYTIYNTWLYIFTIITAFRLDCEVFNKGMSKFRDDRDGYTASMQTAALTITTVILIIYLIFHDTINAFTELNTLITLLMFLELYVTPAISFWTLRNRYEYKYKTVVALTLGMTISNAVLGIIAVCISQDKGMARIVSCVIVQLCFGIFIFCHNYKKSKNRSSLKYIKFALLFNLPLMPHYFSSYIFEQSDRIMIQKICGIEKAGIYSVAYSAGMVMKIITTSTTSALIPWQYSKLEKEEYKEINRKIIPILIVIVAFLLMFIAFAPEFMKVLASKQYYEAIYVIPPITASIFFIFIYGIFNNIELYFDANKFTMYIALFGATLNVILNYIFIQRWGYVAASYTSLFCYIVLCVLHYQYMNSISIKKFGNRIFDTRLIVYISMAIILGALTFNFLYKYIIIRYSLFLLLLIVIISRRNKLFEIFKQIVAERGK